MNPPIFITGLPRSRTAWLSAYLSMPGAIVDHERQRQFPTVTEYLQSFREPVTGDASSLLPIIHKEVATRFPSSPWVYVYRDPDEALEAAVAACNPDLEGYIRRGWPRLVELNQAVGDLPHVFRVDYHRLDDPDVMRNVMKFLGLGWGPRRFELFRRLNVQVQQYEPDDWEWMRDTIPAPRRIRSIDHEFVAQDGLAARVYQDEDFATLAKWADAHGATADPRRLPPFGVVVEQYGHPVGMVFAQLAVDRPVAYIEDPVAKPSSSMADTLANFRFAIGAIKAALLSMGYDSLIANTSPGIARTLRNWGWAERETGLVKLETSTAS